MDKNKAEKLLDKIERTLKLCDAIEAAFSQHNAGFDKQIAELQRNLTAQEQRLEILKQTVADGAALKALQEEVQSIGARLDAHLRDIELQDALRSIGYSEAEVKECMTDVPDLTLEDIHYVKPIFDNYDATTEEWNTKTFAAYSQMRIFPKLETSALRKMRSCLAFRTLCFIPLFDVSGVTSALSPWCTWLDNTGQGVDSLDGIKRMPAFDWSSLEEQRYLYCGLHNLKYSPPLKFPKLKGTGAFLFGDCHNMTKWDISMDWSKLTDFMGGMRGSHLVELPTTEFLNATSLAGAFASLNIADLSDVTIRAPKCIRMLGTFCGWLSNPNLAALVHAPQLELPPNVDMHELYASQEYLRTVPDYSHLEPSNIELAFVHCRHLRRLSLNFENIGAMQNNYYFRHTFGASDTESDMDGKIHTHYSNVEYFSILNLGKRPECTSLDFSLQARWGVGSEENLQSLIDSLLTNSFNRAEAGYSPLKLILSPMTLNLLSEPQRTAITEKGYTLATASWRGYTYFDFDD